MSSTPWSSPDADPIGDLRHAWARADDAALDRLDDLARDVIDGRPAAGDLDLLPIGHPITDAAREQARTGFPPPSTRALADLYLTGEGRDVAQALGVPVHRTNLLDYGTVIEDRTAGELRLYVGTRGGELAAILAGVRAEATLIVHRGLKDYGDPAYHRQRIKAAGDAAILTAQLVGNVRAAEELERRLGRR